MAGQTDSSGYARIYENRINQANTTPSAPQHLSAVARGNMAKLSWSGASDSETLSSTGLTYQLMIGSSTAGMDILAPMAIPISNGYRLIPESSAIHTQSYVIKNLSDGIYYWSVQAIDSAGKGSDFSTEHQFRVDSIPPIISEITNISMMDTTANASLTFTATDASSNPCTLSIWISSSNTDVLSSENTSVMCQDNNYTLTIAPQTYGESAITVTIMDAGALTASTSFNLTVIDANVPPHFSWIDDQEIALNTSMSIPLQLTDNDGNPVRITGISSNLSLIQSESIQVTGNNVSKNQSTYTITTLPAGQPQDLTLIVSPDSEQAGVSTITITAFDGSEYYTQSFSIDVLIFTANPQLSLTPLSYGDAIFCDYDQDGDQDLFHFGHSTNGPVSILYKNMSGEFNEITEINLPGIEKGAAAFGDYDLDGDPDLLMTGQTSTDRKTYLYQNTGSDFLLDTRSFIPGVSDASLAFIDYDQDGDLDIYIAGDTGSQYIGAIYQNKGGLFYLNENIELPEVFDGSVSIGDYDLDGDSDLLISGDTIEGKICYLYENRKGIFYKNNSINLTQISLGKADFIDFDSDNDLDIVLTGESTTGRTTKIYQNTSGHFETYTAGNLIPMDKSHMAIGDFDNDSDSDLLISGETDNGYQSILYQNKNSAFFEQTGVKLPAMSFGKVFFVDHDRDNDLDIFVVETSDNAQLVNLYTNHMSSGNTAPSAPDLLSAVIKEDTAILTWNSGSDSQQLSATSLSYHIQMGTSSGTWDIMSPLSLDNGTLITSERGIFQNLTTTVSSLPEGTLFWRIQSIDSGYLGSSFSMEHSFDIDITPPVIGGSGTIQTTSISAYAKSLTLTWQAASDNLSSPSSLEYCLFKSSTNYEKDISSWKSTATAMSNWISNTQIHINGINENAPYYLAIMVRDQLGNESIYKPIEMALFKQLSLITFPSFINSDSLLVDVDMDGDLDILLTGQSTNGLMAKIYKNSQGNFDSDQSISLPGVFDSAAASGDMDNDGDPDIVMIGIDSSYQRICRVYFNGGDDFSSYIDLDQQGMSSGNIALSDYDCDGDMDIFISGQSDNGPIARIYVNQ